eukprot:TRINITY_DN75742_c0_g1_i1.p1 TRINITY_DN75742_c0_g1~~TRINITY_DN75742_c0_g1_i1.p1  ORF type:complete len:499 (+),score=86.43 TRINITY_DN75742_c0_g1_i1:80-1576(+)
MRSLSANRLPLHWRCSPPTRPSTKALGVRLHTRTLCASTSDFRKLTNVLQQGSAADERLLVWACASSDEKRLPDVLLVCPEETGQRGSHREWLRTVEELLALRSPRIWVAEWRGLGHGPEDQQETVFQERRGGSAAALANLLEQANNDGQLRLVCGSGSAGLLALQAVRHQRIAQTAEKSFNGRVMALAPRWNSPLRSKVGEAYPSRIARRQRFYNFCFTAAATCGLGGMVSQRLGATHAADLPQVARWWLGFLDPVTNKRDAAREFLLTARAVTAQAGAQAYQVAASQASSRLDAADDIDDEEFAVGSAAKKSQRRLSQEPDESNSAPGDCKAEEKSELGQLARMSGVFAHNASQSLPVSVVLSDALRCPDQVAASSLTYYVQSVRQKLHDIAYAALEQGMSHEQARTATEAALVVSLLELDMPDFRGGQSGSSDDDTDAESTRAAAAAIVDDVLPVHIDEVKGCLAWRDLLEEQPQAVAELMDDALKLVQGSRQPE